MQRVKTALVSICLASLLSGCSVLLDSWVHNENAKPCAGLPDAGRQSCLQRRGETSIVYEPPPKKITAQ